MLLVSRQKVLHACSAEPPSGGTGMRTVISLVASVLSMLALLACNGKKEQTPTGPATGRAKAEPKASKPAEPSQKPRPRAAAKPPAYDIGDEEVGVLGEVRKHLETGGEADQIIQGEPRLLGERAEGVTRLHMAAANGHKAVAELLIARGADVNRKAESESRYLSLTPLQLAAAGGHAALLRLLLEKGARLEAPGDTDSPLYLAIERGQAAAAAFLLNHGSKWSQREMSAVDTAIREGHKDVVRVLLEHSQALARWTGRRGSFLHMAAQHGRVEIAKLLLAKGADVNAKNSRGSTPLHVAAGAKGPAVAALLLKHDAQPDARNNAGQTPLDVARRAARPEIIKLLEPPKPTP